MTFYSITRHPGATAWAAECGLQVDRQPEHLEPDLLDALRPGDVVAGILPVNLAAEVCDRGARFLCLSLDMPPPARGRELSAEEMRLYNARLEEFRVLRVPSAARKFVSGESLPETITMNTSSAQIRGD